MADERTSTEADWPVPWQPVVGEEDGLLARLQAWLVLGACHGATRLPESLFSLGVVGLARFAKVVDRRHANAARRFVRLAFPEASDEAVEARVLASYRHFLRILLQTARVCHRVPAERMVDQFDIEWTDEARAVVESSGGSLLVTPHIGNWEAALTIARQVGLGPLYAIAKPVKNRYLSECMQAERERRGIRLLPRRGAMVEAPKVIRAGGSIAMLLDQRARKRPILAPFFGRPARCDRSAGVLMKRLRVPALVFSCTLTEDPQRFRVRFYDCLSPEEIRDVDPVGIATRLNQAFERMILDEPDQYFWLHDRFKDTPEEFPEESADEDPGSSPEARTTPQGAIEA